MTQNEHPDLPLPSIRSLGLLDTDPSTPGWQEVLNDLPPLRLGLHTMQGQQGEQPPQQNGTHTGNPFENGLPEPGNLLAGADDVLVPVGEIHPQMAGEGNEQGGQGGGGLVVHYVDFYQRAGKIVKVEWITQW